MAFLSALVCPSLQKFILIIYQDKAQKKATLYQDGFFLELNVIRLL